MIFEYKLERLKGTADSTIGVFTGCGLAAFSCEDEFRSIKIKGETRIPAGRYQIKFNEATTGMTVKYRNRFSWFTFHLELQGVPGFSKIYIHIGNSDDDTDGCILVGSTADLVRQTIGGSTDAYTSVYKQISQQINEGHEVWLTVTDEDPALGADTI